MARTPDDTIRAELLERAVDYVCRHGLSGLSVRPLAKALGSSPSLLLYHFESKDALIMAIIRTARERQQHMMARLDANPELSQGDVGRMLWREFSSPKYEPLVRLFFEVYGMALQERSRFRGFLKEAVWQWIDAVEASLPSRGTPEARVTATIMVDAFRGFLLDLCATRDRARIDVAVDTFFTMLDANPMSRGHRAAS